jgi:hypothetical protein
MNIGVAQKNGTNIGVAQYLASVVSGWAHKIFGVTPSKVIGVAPSKVNGV